MPTLDQTIVQDLTARLTRFLQATGGYDELKFLDAGGSAAVFRVQRGQDVRAVKAFDPALFHGPGGAAERRRLHVQRRLIGHTCPSLVQTYRVDEAEDTAFIEMEFVDWPQLARKLRDVPDETIVPLITQLVDAVRYLDGLKIVHRDIKPENIHVSLDYKTIKLLDLGVVREFDWLDESDATVTDSGARRPFLATAQYSSPEYLFRLDEPTEKLWRGLNFYQVGAILHDLIKKEALFQYEVNLGNRWLVARAVLMKQPTFSDTEPHRLPGLKALAIRCLTKDIDTRLALVGWEDFLLEGDLDPKAALRDRLSKGLACLVGQPNEAPAAKLTFERNEYIRRFSERLRTELIGICETNLPLTMRASDPGEPSSVKCRFSPNSQIDIECVVVFAWQSQIYEKTANVEVGARILCCGKGEISGQPQLKKPTAVIAIQSGEDEAVQLISTEIARRVGLGLDQIEAVGADIVKLHLMNLE
ncbi:conserved hypothetical protein [Thiomonas arsenitoxydans]|nr:protein kinase [Thiomonas arsenitoxydans]CQR37106.1 conserved hypothetical protein [Thiomonas arsenitoxydans]CQR38223.1 conserved hypothetical protein [Thiomonas arsenitoxydans]CQR40384.1 conserved hypothetical protein [Thiomonas arsenitoxydans]CQR40451.1 conserved hypothetical protein [Thiomonas arsenitoxydans]